MIRAILDTEGTVPKGLLSGSPGSGPFGEAAHGRSEASDQGGTLRSGALGPGGLQQGAQGPRAVPQSCHQQVGRSLGWESGLGRVTGGTRRGPLSTQLL